MTCNISAYDYIFGLKQNVRGQDYGKRRDLAREEGEYQ